MQGRDGQPHALKLKGTMRFLVFEGLDGSGKSTLMRLFAEELRSRGLSSMTTREPGGTKVGEEIRETLLRKREDAPHAVCEILLYEASRAQHVSEKIQPALKRGEWVLCDRFTASTVAFQSGGRKIGSADVDWLNRFAIQGCEPDLNILLDLSLEESESRRQSRGQESDRLESESRDFHQRVMESYRAQATQSPQRWLVLPATKTPEALLNILVSEMEKRGWWSA